MRRKMRSILAMSLATVILLTGCGNGGNTAQDSASGDEQEQVTLTTENSESEESVENAENTQADSGEKIVLRLVGPMENENDTTNPVTKQTIRGYYVIKELYEAEHPNIELELTGIPWDSWQAKLTTAAAANSVDIVVHGASIVDVVEDLTPYAEKDGEFLNDLLLKYSYGR